MRGGIFSRIFAVFALVVLLSLVLVEVYITRTVRADHISDLQDSLAAQAALIARTVSFEESAGLDDLCRELKERTGARVTVIRADGRVMGDSDAPHDEMDNHAGRPEVQRAFLAGRGSAVRHSDTLGYDLLYTALRVGPEDRPHGFIRLSVPLVEVSRSINLIRARLVFAVGLVLLATGGLSILQTARIRRLVRQVTDFSGSLARGNLRSRLVLEGVGEFGAIAGNLNKMAEELFEMVSRSEEERDRLGAILRSVPNALLILDADNTVALASAASRGFFGTEGVTGRPVSEVMRSPEFFDMLDAVRRDLEPRETETVLERPGEKHVIIRISPLMHKEGGPMGLVVLFHDISDFKRLEQVRKDFVANVSHELKTPVAAIKGFSETLLDGALEDGENARRFVEIIRANSERINSLVDDLMTISKIELGVTRIEKKEWDLEEVLGQVTAVFGDRAAAKGLYLRTSLDPDAGKAFADRDRLIQIFTNLVDNAIKFTDTGGVTLGSGVEGDRKFLFVGDTGIGIPEKHLPRIGERFYRVDPSRSRELGGTGLGLAIVKHLVRAHGWDMEIQSAENRGTTVRIYL